jgi:hypothetical protein
MVRLVAFLKALDDDCALLAVEDNSPRSQQLSMKALFYKSPMTFRGVSAICGRVDPAKMNRCAPRGGDGIASMAGGGSR